MAKKHANRPLDNDQAAARCKYYLKSGEMSVAEVAEKFGFKSLSPLYAIMKGTLKGHIPAAKKSKEGKFTYPEPKDKPTRGKAKKKKPKKAKRKVKTSDRMVAKKKTAAKAKAAPKKAPKKAAPKKAAPVKAAPKKAAAPKAAKVEMIDVKVGMVFVGNDDGLKKEVVKIDGNKVTVASHGAKGIRNIPMKLASLAKPSKAKKGFTLVS